jgi:hypothetical protein
MKHKIAGLANASSQPADVPKGVYLVRVESLRFERERVRPFYLLRFSVLEPSVLTGRSIIGRLWCTPKALWKLSWFLWDFGYDQELLGRDEIDDKRLVGLRGVLKISHTTVNGHRFTNLDAFAPVQAWDEVPGSSALGQAGEVAS